MTDEVAIQAAIDANVYPVYLGSGVDAGTFTMLPAKLYTTAKPIHLHYGTGFGPGRLKGSGAAYRGNGGLGTAIVAAFSNGPCVSIQGARRSELSDIGFVGLNRTWIEAAGRGPNVADWIDTALPAGAGSRYGPYACIAVDPYTAAIPAYPAVDYPAFLGVVAQGNKARSSDVVISRCDISGFVVGVVIHPGENSDGNGDFVRLRDCRIQSCVYGFSVGNTQSRLAALHDVFMDKVHTAFTNRVHGKQTGRMGPVINGHVGSAIQIFDFGNTSLAGPIVYEGLYTENIWRIGSIIGSTSSEVSIAFNDCRLSFGYQQSNPQFGVPARSFSVLGQPLPLVIRGGYANDFRGALLLDIPAAQVDLFGLQVTPENKTFALYECFALNALAGGISFRNLGGLNAAGPNGRIQPKFLRYNLDTGASLGTIVMPDPYPSKRDRCTPLWATKHVGVALADDEGVYLPQRAIPIGLSPSVLSATLVGRTLTLTFVSRSDGTFTRYGPLPGDVLLHQTSGAIFFVSARTGLTVTAIQQTGYKPDGAGNFVPLEPIDFTSGTLWCANSRCYHPEYPICGDFAAGSNVITNVGLANGFHGNIESNIAVGDSLLIDDLRDNTITQVNARVTARDNVARTITLSGNAAKTVVGKRLGTFIRLPPPNV